MHSKVRLNCNYYITNTITVMQLNTALRLSNGILLSLLPTSTHILYIPTNTGIYHICREYVKKQTVNVMMAASVCILIDYVTDLVLSIPL